MNPLLDLYLYDRLVGHVEYQPQSTQHPLRILLIGPKAMQLGPGDRYRPDAQTGLLDSKTSTRFLQNLLPEGPYRRIITSGQEVADADLLVDIGFECAGAISLTRAGDAPSSGQYTPLMRPVEDYFDTSTGANLRQIIRRGRLSQAGEMPKFGLHRDGDGEWFIPQDGAKSTWIVKGPRDGLTNLAVNEYACLALMKLTGLPVADSMLLGAKQEVLAVKRYDRQVMGDGTISSLHQIDGCQLLGVDRGSKYQHSPRAADGGFSEAKQIGQSITSAQIVAQPVKTGLLTPSRHMLRWHLANAVLGNNDGHLKNFSAWQQTRGGPWSLAPVYDVLNTEHYPGHDQRFAIKIGKYWFTLASYKDDWLRLGKMLGASPPEVEEELQIAKNWIEAMRKRAESLPELNTAATRDLKKTLLERLVRAQEWHTNKLLFHGMKKTSR